MTRDRGNPNAGWVCVRQNRWIRATEIETSPGERCHYPNWDLVLPLLLPPSPFPIPPPSLPSFLPPSITYVFVEIGRRLDTEKQMMRRILFGERKGKEEVWRRRRRRQGGKKQSIKWIFNGILAPIPFRNDESKNNFYLWGETGKGRQG